MRPQGFYDTLKESHREAEANSMPPEPPLTYAEKLVNLQQQPLLNDEEREIAAQAIVNEELQAKEAAGKINSVERNYEGQKRGHMSLQGLIAEAQRLAKAERNKSIDGQRWDGELTQAEWRQAKLETSNMSLDELNKDARNRSLSPSSPEHTPTIER